MSQLQADSAWKKWTVARLRQELHPYSVGLPSNTRKSVFLDMYKRKLDGSIRQFATSAIQTDPAPRPEVPAPASTPLQGQSNEERFHSTATQVNDRAPQGSFPDMDIQRSIDQPVQAMEGLPASSSIQQPGEVRDPESLPFPP